MNEHFLEQNVNLISEEVLSETHLLPRQVLLLKYEIILKLNSNQPSQRL